MKNMTKNENKLYALIVLVIIIGFPAFLQSDIAEYSYQISILERNAIYAVATVSMNLLTGFTGLFLLGQVGFMTIGAYVVAISTIPVGSRASVHYVNGILPIIINIQLFIPVVLLPSGLTAAAIAAFIGIPVLRLKSDYLATAVLGFSEIIRTFIAVPMFDTITNGSYDPRSIPGFPNILAVLGLATLCIALMVLPINSSYGRVFEFIREDEVAVQSMGISLFHHKELSFVISSFFTGAGGGMLAMSMQSINSKIFQIAPTCGILLIVVLGGIGSVTGNVTGAFLVTAGRELLRFFDDPLIIARVSVPLSRSGFRMVIFSTLLIVVVLLYSRGIMGNHEFSQGGLLRLIQGIPSKFRRGRKKPSSAKRGGIHR